MFIKHFFHVRIFCGFLSEVAMMLFLADLVVICNGEALRVQTTPMIRLANQRLHATTWNNGS